MHRGQLNQVDDRGTSTSMAANRISLKTGKEVVHSVEFSPYQQSSSLLAVGGRSQVSIKACNLKVNFPYMELSAHHFDNQICIIND